MWLQCPHGVTLFQGWRSGSNIHTMKLQTILATYVTLFQGWQCGPNINTIFLAHIHLFHHIPQNMVSNS